MDSLENFWNWTDSKLIPDLRKEFPEAHKGSAVKNGTNPNAHLYLLGKVKLRQNRVQNGMSVLEILLFSSTQFLVATLILFYM